MANLLTWQRQKGETEKAFEAFASFRDMGLERTKVAVAEMLQKSYTLINRWSWKFHWAQRVHSYDLAEDKKRLVKVEKERREMQERHLKGHLLFQGKVFEAMQEKDFKGMSGEHLFDVFDDSTKSERLLRGLPTEKVEHSFQDGNNPTDDIRNKIISNAKAREHACGIIRAIAGEPADPDDEGNSDPNTSGVSVGPQQPTV